jgi:hypothetical protein
MKTGPWFHRCFVLTAAFCTACQAGSATLAPDKQTEYWATLEYASRLLLQTVSMTGVRTSRTIPLHEWTTEQFEKQVKMYEKDLREKIERGELALSEGYRQRLQQDFGVTDYRKVLNNPMVRHAVNVYVETLVKTHRQDLFLNNSPTEEEVQFRIDAATNRGARIHTVVLKKIFAKEPDSEAVGEEKMMTVNSKELKEFYVKGKAGILSKGESSHRGLIASLLGDPSLMRAGQPRVTAWSEKDLKNVQSEDTPEGKSLKFSFDSGDRYTAIMWVLPAKGYRIFREELAFRGEITNVETYGNYEEIEPGHWFPKKQHFERYEQRKLIEVQDRNIETIKPNPKLSDDTFDQEFPNGTSVTDLRNGSNAAPLHYAVGGFSESDLKLHISRDVTPDTVKGSASAQTNGTASSESGVDTPAEGKPIKTRHAPLASESKAYSMYERIWIYLAAVGFVLITTIGLLLIHRRRKATP